MLGSQIKYNCDRGKHASALPQETHRNSQTTTYSTGHPIHPANMRVLTTVWYISGVEPARHSEPCRKTCIHSVLSDMEYVPREAPDPHPLFVSAGMLGGQAPSGKYTDCLYMRTRLAELS